MDKVQRDSHAGFLVRRANYGNGIAVREQQVMHGLHRHWQLLETRRVYSIVMAVKAVYRWLIVRHPIRNTIGQSLCDKRRIGEKCVDCAALSPSAFIL